MKIRSIKYYVKEGFIGLFKNRLMTLASFATISACIFIVIFAICVVVNVRYSITEQSNRIGIRVFTVDSITDERLTQLEDNINKVGHVRTVRYISPDEALDSLKEDLARGSNEEVALWERLESDPSFALSKSFEISLEDASYSESVIRDLNALPDVKKVNHEQEVIDLLTNAGNIIGIVSVFVVAVLGVISVVIVMNTIKLTVYVRRKEINIMKYVGATDWFIRWPFIIEGMIIGALGALFPVLISWFGYGRFVNSLYTGSTSMIDIIGTIISFKMDYQIFPVLLPVCVFIGLVLGAIGSIYSIRKHLNV